MTTHLHFTIPRNDVREGILIPKYYDPDIDRSIESAKDDGYDTVELGEILCSGDKGSRLGDWIRREHYGTGNIPYVRTSDLTQWRIRPDFKKGVAEPVYDKLKGRQDVRANDILFVAHGTYLVGTSAIVLPHEIKIILQDHVFRLRAKSDGPVPPELLLALLTTRFVKRQVRSRQFSADIIDKIGNRHLGIKIAVPGLSNDKEVTVKGVRRILASQTTLRRRMNNVVEHDLRLLRERAQTHFGFSVARSEVREGILIPKYYNPEIERDLIKMQMEADVCWISLGDLVSKKILSAQTGVEVGKMAYGTGDTSFIRTSDIAGWEVKRDVRQGISQEFYKRYSKKASVEINDILVVRDGTYLVGSSAVVMPSDLPALICGGMYRLRSLDRELLNPFTLLGFLNLPIVKRQMRARQFTRDVIDTLGNRLLEVRIPEPSSDFGHRIGTEVESLMIEKERLKVEIATLIGRIEPSCASSNTGRPGWSMR